MIAALLRGIRKIVGIPLKSHSSSADLWIQIGTLLNPKDERDKALWQKLKYVSRTEKLLALEIIRRGDFRVLYPIYDIESDNGTGLRSGS